MRRVLRFGPRAVSRAGQRGSMSRSRLFPARKAQSLAGGGDATGRPRPGVPAQGCTVAGRSGPLPRSFAPLTDSANQARAQREGGMRDRRSKPPLVNMGDQRRPQKIAIFRTARHGYDADPMRGSG